jgi:lauroyl/myristoyl acyltransferase
MIKLWILRVCQPPVCRFPRFFYRVALVVGWAAWWAQPDVRRRVTRNLTPWCDGDRKRAHREGLRVSQNVAQYYVDILSVPGRTMATFERDHLNIIGAEHMATLEAPGPVVAVSAHTGNGELAVQALTYRGRGFVALVQALEPPEFSRRMVALRSSAGGRFFESDFGGLRACIQALKEGELLALMGDRDIQHTGICIMLAGRLVRVPRGPWELARRTNALIVPVFCSRRRFDALDLLIEEPFRIDVTDSPEADIRKAAERYAMLLETHLRADPGQWVVLEDFWRVHACEGTAE